MLKNIVGGMAVGIANIIPGVSGGTMMVILGIFNRVNDAISGIFSKANAHRKEDILFLCQVLLGAAIGLVGFAKILSWCFEAFQTETMFWFMGLVFFSIPVFMKNEMKDEKISWGYIVAGMGLIFVIAYLAPDKTGEVNPLFPDLSVFYLVKNILIGIIAGATMLLPGVSGSMVLLILGEYYLFKSLVASVLSFQLNVLVPLFFMGIGILMGIVLAAKLIKYFMAHYKKATLSFILGLIVASTIVLFPIQSYDFMSIVTCLVAFGIGGLIVALIEKIA